MPIERIDGYKFEGKVYETLEDAKQAEAKVELQKWLTKEGVGAGGIWSQEMFYNHLLDHFECYIKLLNRFDREPT